MPQNKSQEKQEVNKRVLNYPRKPFLKINSSDLLIVFRDFGEARDRKPNIKILAAIVISALPAIIGSFPDVFGIPGQTIRGIYIGIVIFFVLLMMADIFQFAWYKLKKKTESEYIADEKVKQLLDATEGNN